MFRKKDTETDPRPARAFRRPGSDAQQAERATRPAAAQGRTAGRTGRRRPSRAAQPRHGWRRGPHADADRYGKRLIVGAGHPAVRRDQLVRPPGGRGRGRGHPERHAALWKSPRSGGFTGGCEVEEADISGVYEGDLTVRKRLFVRGTGRLTGTIRYGELELERGGQIAGNISVISTDSGSKNVGAAARSRPALADVRRGRRRAGRPESLVDARLARAAHSGARSLPGRRPRRGGSSRAPWRRADAVRSTALTGTSLRGRRVRRAGGLKVAPASAARKQTLNDHRSNVLRWQRR